MTRTVQGWARVQVTVEVSVGPWGDDVTVGEIADRAEREGVETVRNEVAKLGWRVVGDPTVQVVIAARDGGAS